MLEDYFRDETNTLRSDVARVAIEFIDRLRVWVSQQMGMRLVGSSLFIVYEGDSTVDEPKPPVVKIMDFEYAHFGPPDTGADTSYMNGIENLRWMLERFACYDSLQNFGRDAITVKKELSDVEEQLRVNSEHAKKMAQVAKSLAPKQCTGYANQLLFSDIRQQEVSEHVQEEQDNCMAALLQAILVKHGINAGHDSFVELLQWKLQPIITDRTYLKSMMDKHAFSGHPDLMDDLLKWKTSDTANIGSVRHIVDGRPSSAQVLPSFKDLMHEDKYVNLVQN